MSWIRITDLARTVPLSSRQAGSRSFLLPLPVLPESLIVYAGEEGPEAAVAGLLRRLQLLEHPKLRLLNILRQRKHSHWLENPKLRLLNILRQRKHSHWLENPKLRLLNILRQRKHSHWLENPKLRLLNILRQRKTQSLECSVGSRR
jgi:hypothetical protein